MIPNIRRLQARGMDFSAAHTPCAICGRGDGDDDPYSWCERHSPGGYELNANGEMRNYTPWETHRAGIGGAIAWLRAEKGDALHHDWQVGTDVCRAIRQHEGDQSAFWAAGFARPHVPLVAPKRFFEALDDLDISLPEEAAQATPLPGHVRGQLCGDFGLSPEQRREAIRAYLACVMFADEQVVRTPMAAVAMPSSARPICSRPSSTCSPSIRRRNRHRARACCRCWRIPMRHGASSCRRRSTGGR